MNVPAEVTSVVSLVVFENGYQGNSVEAKDTHYHGGENQDDNC